MLCRWSVYKEFVGKVLVGFEMENYDLIFVSLGKGLKNEWCESCGICGAFDAMVFLFFVFLNLFFL